MFKEWKQQWQAFKKSRPGSRFRDRYERSRQTRSSKPAFLRFLQPVIALLLVAAGVVFCAIPGPGVPLLIIGAGLLADEWRPLAQALDWLEVRIRSGIAKAKRWWCHAPLLARSGVILVAAVIAGGAAYGGFRFITSN